MPTTNYSTRSVRGCEYIYEILNFVWLNMRSASTVGRPVFGDSDIGCVCSDSFSMSFKQHAVPRVNSLVARERETRFTALVWYRV